jgi:ATP-dependent Lon protease
MEVFKEYNEIKLVLSLQHYYRHVKNRKDEVTNKIRSSYELLYNTMSHIQENYDINIFTKSVYNSNMDELDSILVYYNFIKLKVRFIKLSIYKLRQSEIFTEILNNRLNNLIENVGTSNITDIVKFKLGIDIIDKVKKEQNLIIFYQKFFIPLSFKYNTNNKKKDNYFNITVKRTLKNITTSFRERLDGATLHLEYENHTFSIKGYFKKDPLNVIRYEGKLKDKNTDIENELKIIDIPADFKNKFIQQVSLRDYVVLGMKDILELLKKSYKDLQKYKQKTLSVLIKEFVKCSPEKQRNILTLFLMSNSDDQFLAHVIYDMIENQSYIYKEQPMAEMIYSSMHWSIQQLFKNAVKNVEDHKRKLDNLSETDISYEKRISLMKVDNSIKKKAYDRLKDLAGGKESSAKALQYLDALLKVPFNIYQKEAILSFIDSFNILLKEKMIFLKSKRNKITNNILQDELDKYIEFYEIIENNNEQSIHVFIKKSLYMLNSIAKNTDVIVKKLNVNCLNILSIELTDDILIINDEGETADIDEDGTNETPETNESNESNENNSYSDNESDVELSHGDSNDDDITMKKEKMYKILNDKTKIPNIEIIKENIIKIKKIQHLKDILIENDKMNENTLKIMQDEIHEIESNIGININKHVVPDNNIVDEEEMDMQYSSDEEIEDIEYVYIEIYNLIDKWVKYKKEKIGYLKNVNNVLDKCIYGHKDAKKQISRLIGQWMNGKMSGTCIGFCGPPGVGKTTICKNGLSKCLVDKDGKERPFSFLPLGGTSNGSLLEGHHYTYLGSTWGKIVDILINSKCMNPIIYIDELDKVSRTENGKEIISILTHLTDQSQNMEFNDRYFSGIPLDLSKAIFVFSYNDSSKIDRILKDRIHEINIKPLNKNEKIKITKNYLLPEILSMVGFNHNDITIKNNDLEFLLDNYTHEAGVRKLNEHLLILVREINLTLIMDEDDITLPYCIKTDYIKKVFSEKQLVKIKKVFPKPQTGLVNGLYATNSGIGGITIIEVLKTPSERAYTLQLTGQQGDVMKESMYCAKTLAWNLIHNNIKKDIKDDWDKNGQWGLHIHCPEGATPKDGPSAGCAITVAIISRLCGVNIRNVVAITGEIDLSGNIGQVGGISSKLEGAINAGVEKVFIPKDNEDDYNKYLKNIKDTMISSDEYSDSENEPTIVKKHLKVVLVSRIEEVLADIFTKKVKFNNIR